MTAKIVPGRRYRITHKYGDTTETWEGRVEQVESSPSDGGFSETVKFEKLARRVWVWGPGETVIERLGDEVPQRQGTVFRIGEVTFLTCRTLSRGQSWVFYTSDSGVTVYEPDINRYLSRGEHELELLYDPDADPS